MEIATIVLIALIVIIAGMGIYLLVFQKKGRKVFLEFYEEMNAGNWYRVDAHKKYKGLVFRDKDGVEKLKIPRKFSKVNIEAPNIESLMPSSRGTPVLVMVKDAEQLFRPTNIKFDDKKTFRAKVEQREALSWLFQEKERTDKQYQGGDFFTKYGAMITLGIIIVGGLLTIWVTADKINELNDDYRGQVLGDTKEQKNFIRDLVNNINGGNNNNVETSEDAERPPNNG